MAGTGDIHTALNWQSKRTGLGQAKTSSNAMVGDGSGTESRMLIFDGCRLSFPSLAD